MATVYEAERSDGVYSQRVALKVSGGGSTPKTGSAASSPNARSSLRSAIPTSPGFSTADLPLHEPLRFLLMELVEGDPLTALADGRRVGCDAGWIWRSASPRQ